MKKLSLILNIIIFSLAGFIALCFFSGLTFRFSNYIFSDHKSELIFLVIFVLICLIVFVSILIFIFYNNTEFKTEKQKAYLGSYIMACIFIISMLFDCRDNRYLPDVLASVKNPEKAIEIMNFLKDEPINIAKSNDKYLIISYRGYVEDNNKLLIKLAENNLIDNNFVKDDNFEKIK